MLQELTARILLREHRYSELARFISEQLKTLDNSSTLRNLSILMEAGLYWTAQDLASRLDQTASVLMVRAECMKNLGKHKESFDLFNAALRLEPTNYVIAWNFTLFLEYFQEASGALRRISAERAADLSPKNIYIERKNAKTHQKLRLGYISSDLNNHIVGRTINSLIPLHSSDFLIFSYQTAEYEDSITKEISKNSIFKNISKLSDYDAVRAIKEDELDVLIDLNGFTRGSKTHLFRFKLASITVAWLGYSGSTGNLGIDFVFVDFASVYKGITNHFSEKIIVMNSVKFPFSPPKFAPDVIDKALYGGEITFGCFNNTAKIGNNVLIAWSEILNAVPNSKIVLKWKSFHDDPFVHHTQTFFQSVGISPDRVICRGFSSHLETLEAYAEVDIALDPFPFSGGITSLEALWMGVPVITTYSNRIIARQTYSILRALALDEFACASVDDYVRCATDLARNPGKLKFLRSNLRRKIKECDSFSPYVFINAFENKINQLVKRYRYST